MSPRLQKADVQVIREQDCRRFYPIQISSRMLCAGFPQGGVDSCSVSSTQQQQQQQCPYGRQEWQRALEYCSAGEGRGNSSKSPYPTLCPELQALMLLSCSVGRCGGALGLQRAIWPLVPGRRHQLGLWLRPAFLPRGLCQSDSNPGLDCAEPQGITPYPLGPAGGAKAHRD